MARTKTGNNPGWEGDSDGHSRAAKKGWRTRRSGNEGME